MANKHDRQELDRLKMHMQSRQGRRRNIQHKRRHAMPCRHVHGVLRGGGEAPPAGAPIREGINPARLQSGAKALRMACQALHLQACVAKCASDAADAAVDCSRAGVSRRKEGVVRQLIVFDAHSNRDAITLVVFGLAAHAAFPVEVSEQEFIVVPKRDVISVAPMCPKITADATIGTALGVFLLAIRAFRNERPRRPFRNKFITNWNRAATRWSEEQVPLSLQTNRNLRGRGNQP